MKVGIRNFNSICYILIYLIWVLLRMKLTYFVPLTQWKADKFLKCTTHAHKACSAYSLLDNDKHFQSSNSWQTVWLTAESAVCQTHDAAIRTQIYRNVSLLDKHIVAYVIWFSLSQEYHKSHCSINKSQQGICQPHIENLVHSHSTAMKIARLIIKPCFVELSFFNLWRCLANYIGHIGNHK